MATYQLGGKLMATFQLYFYDKYCANWSIFPSSICGFMIVLFSRRNRAVEYTGRKFVPPGDLNSWVPISEDTSHYLYGKSNQRPYNEFSLKLGYIRLRSSQEWLIIYIAEKFTLSKITVTNNQIWRKTSVFLGEKYPEVWHHKKLLRRLRRSEKKNKTLTLFCVLLHTS